MAVPAQLGRRWAGRRMRIVASALAVAVLFPVGVLFVDLWRDIADQKSFATQERRGVEYVVALSQVTFALTDAQSAAVGGRDVPSGDLAAAIEATAVADERLGDDLRVRERWSDLRARVELLYRTDHDDPREAYTGYREATGLLLDLHDRLRENSGLIQDAEPDVYYLQDGAIEELPEAVVAAGRLVDLVVMAAAGLAGEPAAENAEISVARVELISPIGDLEDNLQAALDSTGTRSLSGNLLSLLDRLLRATDTLLAAVPADGRVAEVDVAQVASVWEEIQAAATDLLDALLVEMDDMISSRVDELTGRQRTAVVTVVLVLLFTLGALWANLTDARRPAGGAAPDPPGTAAVVEPDDHDPPTVDGVPVEMAGWERSGAR